jgi:5-methyltetrahydrofolate--homocysteine methyltransferase
MTLSDGFAVMPEQSTVAIVAHHPQAVYFGMKSGFIPKENAPDELIAGTERGGELPPEEDPGDGVIEAETEVGGEPVSA